MLPDPRALPYVGDARWLGKIRATAAAQVPRRQARHLRLRRQGPQAHRGGRRSPTASRSSSSRSRSSRRSSRRSSTALKSDEARASEMEHAIRNEIHVKLEENPAFYPSLRERLEKIIEDRKAKRIDAAQQLKLFEALTGEMRGGRRGRREARPDRDRLRHLRPAPREPNAAQGRGADGATYERVDEGTGLAPRGGARAAGRDRRLDTEGRRAEGDAAAGQAPAPGGQVDAEKVERLAASIVDLVKARKGR